MGSILQVSQAVTGVRHRGACNYRRRRCRLRRGHRAVQLRHVQRPSGGRRVPVQADTRTAQHRWRLAYRARASLRAVDRLAPRARSRARIRATRWLIRLTSWSIQSVIEISVSGVGVVLELAQFIQGPDIGAGIEDLARSAICPAVLGKAVGDPTTNGTNSVDNP